MQNAKIEIRNSTLIGYLSGRIVHVPIVEYVLASKDHEITVYGFAKP